MSIAADPEKIFYDSTVFTYVPSKRGWEGYTVCKTDSDNLPMFYQ